MAKLTKEIHKVQKTIEVEETVLNLTLTQFELDVLCALTGYVVGGGKVRDATDRIFYATKDYRTNKQLGSAEVFVDTVQISGHADKKFTE